ncbi:MAG: Na+/H+ antiporter subunit E [Austwickia sp.]|jgi:multicomponent Na+:H+ antiporter subunit E|nr:Na+/H+ antiporter subunit E [Austwickia sp.]MBK8434980.1 Na+/H+ antiporter subunit E [Austwickia sp.]MBK9101462.1 Na+/H+ antiporter subunit E [Austwickia sp.]
MTRLGYALAYLAFIVAEVVAGSLRVAAAALGIGPASTPSIVEVPLSCRTDLEITAMASSITITPGTLVLGTAAASDDAPPTLFVHSMFGRDRQEVLAGLADMERRLLRVTRGARASGEGS